jgi:hypothetical protein
MGENVPAGLTVLMLEPMVSVVGHESSGTAV